jgi:hypothetical protein
MNQKAPGALDCARGRSNWQQESDYFVSLDSVPILLFLLVAALFVLALCDRRTIRCAAALRWWRRWRARWAVPRLERAIFFAPPAFATLFLDVVVLLDAVVVLGADVLFADGLLFGAAAKARLVDTTAVATLRPTIRKYCLMTLLCVPI